MPLLLLRSPFYFLRRFLGLSVTLALPVLLPARPVSVVTYNVENLHDLDGVAVYEDYQSDRYTPAALGVKATNIVRLLARVDAGAGPDLILLNEIELDQTPTSTVTDYTAWLASVANRKLADLLALTPLPPELAGLPAEAWLLKACADAGLGPYYVATTDERPGTHEDGRGVAVRNLALSRFPITSTRSHHLTNARAILELTVTIEGHPLTLLVNHWKSGASDVEFESIRRDNARVLRARLDELFAADRNADVLVAGDLNSHYNQKQRYRTMRTTGINDILGSQGNELALRSADRDLYNLWFELPSDQRGSDTYQNEWGTLMHLIVSRGLYDQNGLQYEDGSFRVLKFPGLNATAFGLPQRWSRGQVPAGFSDHFPLYARFRTVTTDNKKKWLALKSPSETADGPAAALPVDTSPVNLFAQALKLSELPAGTNLRDGAYTGRVFLIEQEAFVNDRGHVKIRYQDLEYTIFSHKKELRDQLRADAREGKVLRLYGELGQYRDEWQFLVQGKEWIK